MVIYNIKNLENLITGGVNMTNGVDYWITAICRKSEFDPISGVKIYRDVFQERNDAEIMTREKVINLVEENKRVYTCPGTPCDKEKGAKVRIYRHNGNKYLRSVEDDVTRDNLGNLPNFC